MQSNKTVLDVFRDFEEAQSKPNGDSAQVFADIVSELCDPKRKVRYNFHEDAKVARRSVDKWDAAFDIPAFLFERQRVGHIPRPMAIFEHQIRPLAEEGFQLQNVNKSSQEYLLKEAMNDLEVNVHNNHRDRGDEKDAAKISSASSSRAIQAIKTVEFARQQAMTNRERRMKLVQESVEDFSTPSQVEKALKLNKY